jgi:hypothetical protein
MTVRQFALIAGIAYVLVGLLGFIPGVNQPPLPTDPDLAVDTAYGRLLGLFPVNALHNIVHLVIGLWGLNAYRSFRSSRSFAKGLAVIYGVLTVMGLIPGLNTLFGLTPLFGNDIWLHLITAAAAAYFGWLAPAEVREPERVGRA